MVRAPVAGARAHPAPVLDPPLLEGPVYTSYADCGQAKSSWHAQEVHNRWERPQPQYSDGS
jgi:hypothetical protein